MRQWLATVFGASPEMLANFSPSGRLGKRVLINEILSLQLIITAIIGALAIAGLYWGGQWVLQDNYSRWAMQWTEELNELGAPLYLPNDDEAILRLESFIDKYPEIDRVSYYQADGSVIYSLKNSPELANKNPTIGTAKLHELESLIGTEAPYLVETSFLNARAFQIMAPVWTESIPGDGLFNFDPSAESPRKQTNLIGFVGLELDFSLFHNRLLTNIKIAISVLP
ncbi:MAG: hypothetical protein ACR2Q3_16645, partial [Woeseiaceae bacterium]